MPGAPGILASLRRLFAGRNLPDDDGRKRPITSVLLPISSLFEGGKEAAIPN
jgi:hypothetical protein